MKRNFRSVQTIGLSALVGVVMLGLAAAPPRAQAKSEPFSHIIVFGDSLSDTGNYYRLSGGSPPPPYDDGRFCNGPIWVEYLGAGLGMQYQPADNFAVGGATTGTFNVNDGFAGKTYPGLQDEITTFQAMAPVTEPERALYVVQAGANDFFLALTEGTSPETLITTGVGNTLAAVQRLAGSGAQFILVMNVPDLGVTPLGLSLGADEAPMLTQLCAAYNQALESALDQLAQAGTQTIRLDAFAVLDQMASTPAAYGFSNVTTPWVLDPSAGSPDQFLFWDTVHPTTGAHRVLAHQALEQIITTFSPSNGKGTPDARANALNGLVNASLHGGGAKH